MSSIDVAASTEEISLVRSLFSVSVQKIKLRRKDRFGGLLHTTCSVVVFEKYKNKSVPARLLQDIMSIFIAKKNEQIALLDICHSLDPNSDPEIYSTSK